VGTFTSGSSDYTPRIIRGGYLEKFFANNAYPRHLERDGVELGIEAVRQHHGLQKISVHLDCCSKSTTRIKMRTILKKSSRKIIRLDEIFY